MIDIVKASAGSGKTYTLAKTYIRLLLSKTDRFAYRHILAVTFTNKATDEMKGRIMQELFILASDPSSSAYLKDFVPSLFADKASLQKVAEELLCNMLHDYSAFSISTIDRFFQQALKAFSREIGQFASYQVELDRKSLIRESVDRILDNLSDADTDAVKWLTSTAIDQLEKGRKYNLADVLVTTAVRLKSEEHRQKSEAYGIDEEKVYSKDNLLKLRSICNEVTGGFERRLKDCAEEAVRVISAAGLTKDNFKYKFVRFLTEGVTEAGKHKVPEAPATFLKYARLAPEEWFHKKDAGKFKGLVAGLQEPFKDIVTLFEKEYRLYKTAYIIKDQLYALGVAGDLYREFNALLKEKNVLSLDEGNTILRDIIDGSDTPFVYEKLGVRFENFLLDEFQDTSRIQWENFRPLLKESNDNANDSLIVGDVKQSIYRWRGSDWHLMSSEVQEEFDAVRLSTLDTNYRSCRNIVEFNNAFFSSLAPALDGLCADGGHEIADIYADVAQKCNKKEEGMVRLTFCEGEEILGRVVASVADAVAAGARPGDIAVLVRYNDQGSEVANALLSSGIKVVTDDSLKIKASLAVRRLVSLLYYADNPANSVNVYVAGSLEIEIPEEYRSLLDLCESLIRSLKEKDEEVMSREVLYVQAFMDKVADYSKQNGNSIHAFLKYWEEDNSSISSPESDDAVRVMTIHKSKGLDFPYVILPYAGNSDLYDSRKTSLWCMPRLEGTPLEEAGRALYDVKLSAKGSADTFFEEDYRREVRKQYVDNINTLYVAMTRAEKVMHIISDSKRLPGDYQSGIGWDALKSNLSQALYMHAADTLQTDETGDFVKGSMPSFVVEKDRAKMDALDVAYPSWPLNSEEKARLVVSTGAADFFSDEGEAGVSASGRIKGVVLHDILSRVSYPDELERSVDTAYMDGDLTADEADEARRFLGRRISAAQERGWFSAGLAEVRNEVALIDCDGGLHRPDRVEIGLDGSVTIIDYKFGRPRPEYEAQVAGYAELYRGMGFADVSAHLWYLYSDDIVTVLSS